MNLKKCEIIWCWRNFASNPKTKRYGGICGTPSQACFLKILEKKENVRAVLDKTIKDSGPYIAKLTAAELDFCIYEEKRKTARKRLEAEKEKRQQAQKAAVSA